MEEALLILARTIQYRKVKSRLASTIGNEQALSIYHQLLTHAIANTKELRVDKIVFYSDSFNEEDEWNYNIYQKKAQSGNDLGERMKKAFETSRLPAAIRK